MSDLKVGDKVGIWHVHQCHACGSDFHLSRTSEKTIKSEDAFFCEDCLYVMKIDKLTEENARLREALSDLIDGYSAYDLVDSTGCSLGRCKEIVALLKGDEDEL